MQIQQEALQLIKQQLPPKILLDFQQVEYLPTTGLSMLVSIQTSTHRKNGQLRLANIQILIRETLRVSRLDQILDIYDTTESALASFES